MGVHPILAALRDQLWKAFDCAEESVYHYTDQGGLIGIIHDRAIRAYSTRYMNDPTEGEHARKIWRAALEKHPEVVEFLQKIWRSMEMECFCASFSLERDSLSQWRGYAADGEGFALGFHPKGFHPQRTSHYGKVLYGRAEQEELIVRTLNEHMPLLETVQAETDVEQLIPPAFMSIMTSFLVFESLMKDAAYQEEREYRRLMLVTPEKLKRTEVGFAQSVRGIKPYVEMPFWNGDQHHFLKEIVIGPLLPFEDTRRTLQMLLESEGYGSVEILASAVPHRR